MSGFPEGSWEGPAKERRRGADELCAPSRPGDGSGSAAADRETETRRRRRPEPARRPRSPARSRQLAPTGSAGCGAPVGGWKSTTPRTPRSRRGRVPEPSVGSQPVRRCWRPGPGLCCAARRRRDRASAAPSASPLGPERVGQRVEQSPQLRPPILLLAHRLGVDAERDVVDEDAPVDLAQVDATLTPVDEGVERADDVFAVDAEVEGEVVAGPGRDTGVRQIVLGGDRGDQRLGAVAAGHRQGVGAAADGLAHQLLEIVARAPARPPRCRARAPPRPGRPWPPCPRPSAG